MFTVVNTILLNTPKTHNSEQMHALINDVDAWNYIFVIIYDKVFTEIRKNVKCVSDIAFKVLFVTRKRVLRGLHYNEKGFYGNLKRCNVQHYKFI